MSELINKKINKKLYDLRAEQKLTRKDLAKKFGCSQLSLYLVERGYFTPSKHLQEKYIEYFSLEKDFFENDLGYSTPIEEEVKIKTPKIRKYYHKRWFKLATLLASVVCFASTSVCYIVLNSTYTNAMSYFSSEIKDAVDYTLEHGEGESISMTTMGKYKYFSNLTYETKNFDSYLGIYEEYALIKQTFYGANISEEKKQAGTNGLYEMSITMEENNQNFLLYLPTQKFEYQGQSGTAFINCYFTNDYKITSFIVSLNLGENREINIKQGELFDEIKELTLNNLKLLDQDMETIFASPKAFGGVCSFADFRNEIQKGNTSIEKVADLIPIPMMLLPTFGFVFMGLFIASFLFAKREKKEREETVKASVYKTVPREVKIKPFVPETVIRCVAITIIILTSVAKFIGFGISKGIFPTSGGDKVFVDAMQSFISVGMVMIFFVMMEQQQHTKTNSMINIVTFFGGLLLYSLELAFISYCDSTGSVYYELVARLLIDKYMPGNIFFGIIAYKSMNYFLFGENNFSKESRNRHRAFRLLSLIPISYILFSIIYFLIHNISGWNIPSQVAVLLFVNNPVILFFVLLYPIGTYLLRYIFDRKYGSEQMKVIEYSCRFNWWKNIIASLIVLVLGLIDVVLMHSLPAGKIQFGTYWYILFIIPFLLLYRNHIGKRNYKFEYLMNGLYIFALGLGYFLMAIVLIIG